MSIRSWRNLDAFFVDDTSLRRAIRAEERQSHPPRDQPSRSFMVVARR
jgi:hypothetical protein